MFRNPLLEKMRHNKPSLGTGCNNPHEVEMLAKLGFDWFYIDQMFTDVDWHAAQTMLWAGEAAGITPVLRVQSNPWLGYNHQLAVDITRAQGIGSQFTIASYSEKKEIEEALIVAKDWHRRALTVHQFKNLDEWDDTIDKMANATYVIPLAETKDTLERAEEVISLEGVKIFRISATDGSKTIGGEKKRPDFNDPKFWKYIGKIVDLCNKHGVYVGMGTSYAYSLPELQDRIKQLVDNGIKMILLQHTAFLFQVAMTGFLEGVKSDSRWS